MIAVFTALTVFAVSVILVRFATVALTLTGLSKDHAEFQALSALTGSGFTTKESEDIVNHPVRRRIAMHLMLLGHVGVVVAIPSLLLSFLNLRDSGDWASNMGIRAAVLGMGLLALILLASSKFVERFMWNLNTWALRKWAHFQVQDFTRLLRFSRNYVIMELAVHAGSWLAGRTLQELGLAREGALVLGIEKCNGEYIGAPRGQSRIEPGDCLILYGLQPVLVQLEFRRAGFDGNLQHMVAITRQLEVLDEEQRIEKLDTGG